MTEFVWRKSSYSTSNGGNCIEVAWHRSSYSHGNGGNCVEAAATGPSILVRDSKLAVSPILQVDRASWASFVTALGSLGSLT
ncbi:toxin [Actinorhabdospora filicis]|uniref:Toxin n=1 Tax=Actinorhabdospora filicis TaxID=1785913 RepID=A0A9W6WDB7_9ACTN|nr:DUF397 domain-containing protein [Actinorhabdospora filicis]GLZ81953.1 toxin [Actinorhabdospora filicis]